MLTTKLFAAGLLAATVLVAQQPSSPIRVDVTLVTVDVVVTDAAGRPVTDLTQQDFQIFEDGEPKEIRTFAPVDSPYSILVLIDRSMSMQNQWPLMDPAIARFIAGLKPQDRISIAAFDERSQHPELLLDWRTVEGESPIQIAINPAIMGNRYARISGVGGGGNVSVWITPQKDFYQALDWSLQRLVGVQGRKGVVVFTDGRQPGTRTKSNTVDGFPYSRPVDSEDDGDFRKLLRAVQESNSRFDFVAVNTDLNPAGGDPFRPNQIGVVDTPLTFGISARSRLEQLAANSGGRVAFPKRPEDTVELYESIATQLGTSFTLGYSPSPDALTDDRYHRIEVRSTREDLKVQQSRDGYSGRR